MKRITLALALLATSCWAPAFSQTTVQTTTKVVATCGTASYTAGKMAYPTQDTTGAACGSGGGGGGSLSATASAAPTPVIAGANKPLNIDLFSGLFITPTDGAGNVINLNSATPAGTNLIGKVGIDQTTVGTTNGVSLAQVGATTVATGNGVVSAGVQRVAIASDNTAFSTNATLQTQTDTVMVGGVNVKEINAVTPLMGNGVTGTGSQRVTIASDNTAFAVTPTNVVAQASTTSGQTGGLTQGAATTAAPTYTTATTNPLSLTTAGALRVDGSAVTQPVGGNVASGASDSGNPEKIGCVYLSSLTTVTTGQRKDCQSTAEGAIRVSAGAYSISANDSLGANVSVLPRVDIAGNSGSNEAFWVANSVRGPSNFEFSRTVTQSFGSPTGVPVVEMSGPPVVHITTATTTAAIKTGAGIIHRININTLVASATITVYDNTTAAGTVLGVITLPASITEGPVSYQTDWPFATGLTIVTSAATDLTVSYR